MRPCTLSHADRLHLAIPLDASPPLCHQEKVFTWVGVRGLVSFVIPAVGDGGRAPANGATDPRSFLDGVVSIELLEGIGPRASKVKQCARRAGIPSGRLEVSFMTHLREEHVPSPPRDFRLRERTSHDFTVTWKKPKSEGEISHYQIDIATTSTSGTYYPWQVLWCGAGHEVLNDPRLVVARRNNEGNKVIKLTRQLREEKLPADQAPSPVKPPKLEKKRTAAKLNTDVPAPKANDDEPVYSYSLPVEPSLFGKLRIRCWAKGERVPSSSSHQLTLPRHQGAAG
eukprot:472240-Prymnesium_polylepis.1